MPTTRTKNLLYQSMLPLFSPGCGRHPVVSSEGHPLCEPAAFERLIRKHHVLGSATLIVSGEDQALILTKSDNPSHIASEDTYFRVASITKMAAAALAMRFCDRGILELDRPAREYFGSSAVDSALGEITLRHLLSHTSGLADPPGLEKDMEQCRPFPEFAAQARKAAPGSSFRYSNLGFGLIGCVMEAVLDQPVGAIFQDHLFTPLGMNATLEGCRLPREKIMPVTRILSRKKKPDLVLTPLGSVPLTSPDPLCHYGRTAGSMYSDAGSLRILLRELIGNESHYLSSPSLAEMKKQQASYGSLSPALSYGLGLLFIQDPALSGSRIIGHQGFAYGCADGAFWEESTGRILITLNGGCSEARRHGRLGAANEDFLRWAFRKEMPQW